MNTDKLRERAFHLIANSAAGTSRMPDNVIIALASYFESCYDCPEQEKDEDGWKPWAVSEAKATIYAIVDAMLAFAAEVAAEDKRDAERWRFGVTNGFPAFHRQIHPTVELLGWRHPSQEPLQGVEYCVDDYPYYDSCESAQDAAIDAALKENKDE